MSVQELPSISRKYECRFMSEVKTIVESASNLKAHRIVVEPHPHSLDSLWRWTVIVEISGD